MLVTRKGGRRGICVTGGSNLWQTQEQGRENSRPRHNAGVYICDTNQGRTRRSHSSSPHEADMINRQFTPQTEAQRKEKGARIYTSKTASPSNIVSSRMCNTVMHSQGIHRGDERKDSEADRQRLPMRTLRKDVDALARSTRETHVLEATLNEKCVSTTPCV